MERGRSDVGEFVGRGVEIERLRALLVDARAGRGRAALVLGEAGNGKTRLAEVFAEAATRAEGRVAWGRCPDAESPPYWPWRQLLRALHGGSSLESLTDATGARDVLFASVADELHAKVGSKDKTLKIFDEEEGAAPQPWRARLRRHHRLARRDRADDEARPADCGHVRVGHGHTVLPGMAAHRVGRR